jgi:DNA-binding MarR family transcriptional regulator
MRRECAGPGLLVGALVGDVAAGEIGRAKSVKSITGHRPVRHTRAMTRCQVTESTVDADAVTDAVLIASRLLVAVSADAVSAVPHTLTLPQFRLLATLHGRGPLKHAALADHLGVNPSTASRMVDRLVAVGMVERRTSPTSRREIVLHLTTAGGQVVREVTEHRRREIANIIAKMPECARNGLVDVLTAFAAAGGTSRATAIPDATWP